MAASQGKYKHLPWIVGLVLTVAVMPQSSFAQPEQSGRSGVAGRGAPGSRMAGSGSVSGSAGSARGANTTRGNRSGRVSDGGGHRRGGGYRRGGGHRSRGYGRGYYGGYGRSYYRPYGFYNSYFYHFPSPYYYGHYGYYGGDGYGSGHYGYPGPDIGAVDINVKPKRAQVYVDGDYIGTADQFDGFPRYLWLRKGTRHLVIYREGFETLARRVKVREGEVIDLREKMVPGDAKEPSEYFVQLPATQSSESEPTERESREIESTQTRPGARSRAVEPARASQPWRERRPRPSSTEALERDLRLEPATLRLLVQPADAVVYLDGRLLGSGEELDRLHSSLLLDPGAHELEVVRPGYQSRLIDFEATAGEQSDLEVKLKKR